MIGNHKNLPGEISYLIIRHIKRRISPDQQKRLDSWIEASEENYFLFEEVKSLIVMQQTNKKKKASYFKKLWIIFGNLFRAQHNKRY